MAKDAKGANENCWLPWGTLFLDAGCWMLDAGCWMLDARSDSVAAWGAAPKQSRMTGSVVKERKYTCVYYKRCRPFSRAHFQNCHRVAARAASRDISAIGQNSF